MIRRKSPRGHRESLLQRPETGFQPIESNSRPSVDSANRRTLRKKSEFALNHLFDSEFLRFKNLEFYRLDQDSTRVNFGQIGVSFRDPSSGRPAGTPLSPRKCQVWRVQQDPGAFRQQLGASCQRFGPPKTVPQICRLPHAICTRSEGPTGVGPADPRHNRQIPDNLPADPFFDRFWFQLGKPR